MLGRRAAKKRRATGQILASRLVLGAALLNTEAAGCQLPERFFARQDLTVDRRQYLNIESVVVDVVHVAVRPTPS